MPKLLESMEDDKDVMVGVLAMDRDKSLEPAVSLGLSTSIPKPPSAPTLLLCLRCRFEEAEAAVDREAEDAPGPGVALGGAAAIGTTPLPPTVAPLAAREP